MGELHGLHTVAIKVVTSTSPEQRERFESEIRKMRACVCPNIVRWAPALSIC